MTKWTRYPLVSRHVENVLKCFEHILVVICQTVLLFCKKHLRVASQSSSMFKFSGFTSWRWMMWQKLHKTYRVTIITQNLYLLEKRCHSHQYLNFEQFRTLSKLYLHWLKWNPDDNLRQVSVVGRWRRTPFWNSPPLRIPERFDFDHLSYSFFFQRAP